ncbi:hypothetical protein DVA67_030485 [Solirubrobacter sp. CPCC 204708]|nr:hypothetical protein [Solirubrobacter deserti]
MGLDVQRYADRCPRGHVGELDLALSAGALWAASAADDSVLRLDPDSGRLSARIPIAAAAGGRVAGPSAVVGGFGSIRVANSLAGTASRIDPQLNAVTATIRVGERPTRIAAGEGGVWVLDAADGKVVRIDPRRNVPLAALDARSRMSARRLPVPPRPSTLAAVAAAEALLDAVARSDGTRASVNAWLRRLRTTTIIGAVRFDGGGDIVGPRFMVMRSQAGATGAATGVPNTRARFVC